MNDEPINLSEERRRRINDRKSSIRKGKGPAVYAGQTTTKLEFSDNLERVKASMDKINRLIDSLREMTRERE